jgi:hypothetical protein
MTKQAFYAKMIITVLEQKSLQTKERKGTEEPERLGREVP